MKAEPLNGNLYRALKNRFGHVKISNPGVAQVARYSKRLFKRTNRSGTEWYLNLIEPGEYYQVCCPFCHDTKYRLYFNHMWGVEDEEGHQNLWLAICYNENCLAEFDRRKQLYDELTDRTVAVLKKAPILDGKTINPEKIVMEWPGPVTRVDQLPEDHRAVQYLRSRSFDPAKIGKFYDVHYCHTSFRWLAQDRLIIPIYMGGKMRGWQARYIGELNWHKKDTPPKYYTCPGTPRRHVIYNIDNAAKYRTGVIVEGPTDVWSFGPMACCTLGSTMTVQQRRTFHRLFAKHTTILLYDEDAWDKPGTRKIVESFEGQFDGGFAAVRLPKGRDPGSMEREFLREFVASEAKSQGVKVSWRKR